MLPPCAPKKSVVSLPPIAAYTPFNVYFSCHPGISEFTAFVTLEKGTCHLLTAAVGFPLTAREKFTEYYPHQPRPILPSPSKRRRSRRDSRDDNEQPIKPFFITHQSQDQRDLAMELCGDDMKANSGQIGVRNPYNDLDGSGRCHLPPTRSFFPCEAEMNSHQCKEEFIHTA